MWHKYMWLDMCDAFRCRFSVFRDFAKIKKTVSISPGLRDKHVESNLFI